MLEFSNMSQQYDLKDKRFHHVVSALFFILSRVGRAGILEIKHSYILLHDLSHHHLSFFSLRYHPGHVLCQT